MAGVSPRVARRRHLGALSLALSLIIGVCAFARSVSAAGCPTLVSVCKPDLSRCINDPSSITGYRCECLYPFLGGASGSDGSQCKGTLSVHGFLTGRHRGRGAEDARDHVFLAEWLSALFISSHTHGHSLIIAFLFPSLSPPDVLTLDRSPSYNARRSLPTRLRMCCRTHRPRCPGLCRAGSLLDFLFRIPYSLVIGIFIFNTWRTTRDLVLGGDV